MGLNPHTVEFLLSAKASGVDFSRTLTIGRQVFTTSLPQFEAVLRKFGYNQTEEGFRRLYCEEAGFTEPFFKILGAKEISSIDVSSYEKASILHDMNQPVPENLKNRFSVVFDGGSLEHIFNFPVAVKNCMEMLSPGGAFLSINPANNFLGHGFYQFSPEVFFRIFSSSNGFRVERVLLLENVSDPAWFEVHDPEQIGARVTLTNSIPTYIYVQARKISCCPIFTTPPYQSDYIPRWNDLVNKQVAKHPLKWRQRVLSFAMRHGPALIERAYWITRGALSVRFNRRFYRKVDIGRRRSLEDEVSLRGF